MGSRLAKGDSHRPKMIKENTKRRMGKSHHQPKELCVTNVIGMDV